MPITANTDTGASTQPWSAAASGLTTRPSAGSCATRKIAGWAMDDNYKTPLITAAIKMAARNLDLPEGAVFHSDRGSNYTSAEFAQVLEELKISQSVGRTGICFDNALAESVNGTVKVELVHRTVYDTRQKAYDDIAR